MKRSPTQQELVFQQHKSLLFSIAYHMLGSVMDAEDCVQEAFLQWYIAEQEEFVENPKAYLSTIVTRRCIDRLRSAKTQRETYVGLWLPEPLVATTDPFERWELNESLSLAFLLLLERLSPIERAVYILRQVFDYDYAEIAPIVGKSAENCRQIMHRARRHLPAFPDHMPVLHAQHRQVFTKFFQAWMNGDMEGLLQVLADEIVLHTDGGGKVRTILHPLYGPGQVTRYLFGLQQKVFPVVKFALRSTWINGQPGLIGYLEEAMEDKSRLPQEREETENGKQLVAWHQRILAKGEVVFVMGLTCVDAQVQEIDIIANPEKLRHIPISNGDDNDTTVYEIPASEVRWSDALTRHVGTLKGSLGADY
ncbi:RNA polymerase sigma-70 factor [Ktedonosporobacter rubrisoli]|uniref:RNA polymerase sigma-70 factor n=1 Tax=Ktedonosporobacter rubrisoli TaxID=2509675 RepID=A0A4P6JLL2_KTERU|nr:RNA polymerase sigma-70 factor [Ktedonosporobacter rubrisoli]QBD75963.1 RNA polymerase sigma-70 factor [Ktedonosporobacter rubrisoli]